MEFGIEKCAMLVMKTHTENRTYKYLGILKADTILGLFTQMHLLIDGSVEGQYITPGPLWPGMVAPDRTLSTC